MLKLNRKFSRDVRGSRGISLLETLAALVILSAGAAVMLTWFSQNATALSRLKESEDIERGRLQAIEYVRSINPVEQPRGAVSLANYRISWTSRQTADPREVGVGERGREAGLDDLLAEGVHPGWEARQCPTVWSRRQLDDCLDRRRAGPDPRRVDRCGVQGCHEAVR